MNLTSKNQYARYDRLTVVHTGDLHAGAVPHRGLRSDRQPPPSWLTNGPLYPEVKSVDSFFFYCLCHPALSLLQIN